VVPITHEQSLLCRARQQGETVKGKTVIATGLGSGIGQRQGTGTCHPARGGRGNIMLNGFGNSADLKEAPRKLASCAIGMGCGAPKVYWCADADGSAWHRIARRWWLYNAIGMRR
jgi:hypothetical protein